MAVIRRTASRLSRWRAPKGADRSLAIGLGLFEGGLFESGFLAGGAR
jgi:hypothetical protein